jgi:hypothetical protein
MGLSMGSNFWGKVFHIFKNIRQRLQLSHYNYLILVKVPGGLGGNLDFYGNLIKNILDNSDKVFHLL